MPTLTPQINSPSIVQPRVPLLTLGKPENLDYFFIWDQNLSSWTDYTAEANSDTPNDCPLMAPNARQFNDAHYVGSVRIFWAVIYDVGSAGGNTFQPDWEYSKGSGSWGTLTDYFGAISEIINFNLVQAYAVFLLPPADFAQDTVNGATAYWVRRVESGHSRGNAIANWIRIARVPRGGADGQVMKVTRG